MSPTKACVALITLLAASSFASSQEVATKLRQRHAGRGSSSGSGNAGCRAASSGDAVIAAADATAPSRSSPPQSCRPRAAALHLPRDSEAGVERAHLAMHDAESWKVFQRAEARNAASIGR